VPVRVHLNAIGEPMRAIDLPATWNAYIAALRAHPAGVSYANRLVAQPPGTHEAQFLQDVESFVPSNITKENAVVTREPGTDTVRLHRVSQCLLPNGGRMTTDEHIAVEHPSGLIIGLSQTTGSTSPQRRRRSKRMLQKPHDQVALRQTSDVACWHNACWLYSPCGDASAAIRPDDDSWLKEFRYCEVKAQLNESRFRDRLRGGRMANIGASCPMTIA
jgi:hypothetical protein